jgi:type IV pilus assembly protein PilB
MELAESLQFAKGEGCSHCQKGGYRGRIGIYEMMGITAKIRDHIFKNDSASEIRKSAIAQGMKTLYVDGIRKVIKGITTMDEVYRNAKRTEQDHLALKQLMDAGAFK